MNSQHSTTHLVHPTEASSVNGSVLHDAANHDGDNSADDADSVYLGGKLARLPPVRAAVDQVHSNDFTSMLWPTILIGTI